MYRTNRPAKGTLKVNQSIPGETIEAKVRRIVNNREPIDDGAPIIFTERKDGVRPEYNIRTDRWELAVEAMDKVTKSKVAKREGAAKAKDAPEPSEGKSAEGKSETGKEPKGNENKE